MNNNDQMPAFSEVDKCKTLAEYISTEQFIVWPVIYS